MKDWSTDPRPGYLVNRASRLYRNYSHSRLTSIGLAEGQVPVIMSLSDGLAENQRNLARAAGVEQPTMAQTLARMERDGLIERSPDPEDGRSSLVRLTPLAKASFPTVLRTLESANEQALLGFSDDEIQSFTGLLKRVISNLEKED